MHRFTRTIAAVFFMIFVSIVIAMTVGGALSNKNYTEPETTWNEPAIATAMPMMAIASVEPMVKVTEPVEEEIDLIALVTMGEAEGETELGKRLVIDTILNRVDDCHFPDNVTDVLYQPNQFSVMWNGRLNRCCVMPEIVELVKEELLNRTNYDCIFFTAGRYSKYGKPMFQECCHYFSSYE